MEKEVDEKKMKQKEKEEWVGFNRKTANFIYVSNWKGTTKEAEYYKINCNSVLPCVPRYKFNAIRKENIKLKMRLNKKFVLEENK